jgi:hypothetical protein
MSTYTQYLDYKEQQLNADKKPVNVRYAKNLELIDQISRLIREKAFAPPLSGYDRLLAVIDLLLNDKSDDIVQGKHTKNALTGLWERDTKSHALLEMEDITAISKYLSDKHSYIQRVPSSPVADQFRQIRSFLLSSGLLDALGTNDSIKPDDIKTVIENSIVPLNKFLGLRFKVSGCKDIYVVRGKQSVTNIHVPSTSANRTLALVPLIRFSDRKLVPVQTRDVSQLFLINGQYPRQKQYVGQFERWKLQVGLDVFSNMGNPVVLDNATRSVSLSFANPLPDPVVLVILEVDHTDVSKLSDSVARRSTAPPSQKQFYLKPPHGARIVTAARGTLCTHPDVFELDEFLSNNVDTNNWKCPICQKSAKYYDLYVDHPLTRALLETSTVDQMKIKYPKEPQYHHIPLRGTFISNVITSPSPAHLVSYYNLY